MKDPGTNPRREITIAGHVFTVPQPFNVGDVCDSGMASTLNQTLAENLRNNFASTVKEAAKAEEGFDLMQLQSELDDYFAEYDFGVRTGGGRTGDPVRALARRIVRAKVEARMKADGRSFKEAYQTAADYNPVLDALLERNPQVMERARKIVEDQKADVDIEI